MQNRHAMYKGRKHYQICEAVTWVHLESLPEFN